MIDSPYGEGHVVLFSNNPFWRAETKGSYFLVFNAILNFDTWMRQKTGAPIAGVPPLVGGLSQYPSASAPASNPCRSQKLRRFTSH